MALEYLNPADLPTPQTYSHVVIGTGTRLVFIAGQEPEDERGDLVGPGDLAAQARQAFANLGRALAAAGSGPEEVAKITIYVVGFQREHIPVIEEARVRLFGELKPADALIGVERLGGDGYLIEVEAFAVSAG
ncbi:RidA family protein [Nonomuraea sediminis]|uniref:RidA family protein n=1 Tax=Nonomuraea sediminis TaxID=2835864 RepID=UPI001BDCF758|nr:RidA family protein [Nonomuraea sediminis]